MSQQPVPLMQGEETIAYTLHGNRYLNITYRCTLRCAFCPKFNGSWDVQGHSLRLRREPSLEEVLEAVGDVSEYKEIVFCGLGEPLLRLDLVLGVAQRLKVLGATVRVNSDGLVNQVQGCDVTPRLVGLVDALSISMNGQNAAVYNRHCRSKLSGSFDAMLDFVRLARSHVPSITLTAIDGLEGVDIAACQQIADELGVDFRRRVLDEVG